MPHIITNAVDGSSVQKDFEPEMDRFLHARLVVREVISQEDIDAIPRTLRISKPMGGGNFVPDIMGWSSGPFIISPSVHGVLEKLEPGRQKYVPIDVVSSVPLGGKMEHGTYYLILPPPWLDAVVIGKTEFIKGFGHEGYEKGKDGKGGGDSLIWMKTHASSVDL